MSKTRDGKTVSARADLTRERILEAAEAVFARDGLNGTRVRAIADAAGVNVATLYLYFPSKSDLHEAVLDRGVRPLLDLMVRFSAGSRGRDATGQIISAIIGHLGRHPHLSRLIYLEAISEGQYLARLSKRWLRPLLEEAVAQLKASDTASSWDERLFPLIVGAFLHLSMGHFALAPLFQEVFGGDPASEDWIERQTTFLTALVDRMFPEAEARAVSAG